MVKYFHGYTAFLKYFYLPPQSDIPHSNIFIATDKGHEDYTVPWLLNAYNTLATPMTVWV